MRKAHLHLGLNDEHFKAVVENLAFTLETLGVSPDDIGEVAKIANSVKSEILNR
ncbi:hypothetical protein [Zhongshania sp.]|uniref:hypothetical protein n=1 Tax=Zhongshania sp. TaxID=1971902 RepID=UPI00356261F5